MLQATKAQRATFSLPTSLTSFVGRKAELAELQQLVLEQRLVSVVGAGGSGKTRLAIEAARAMRDQFADGVVFVPLSAVSESTLVGAAIRAALGAHEVEGQPLAEVLSGWLSDRHVLL